MSKPEKAITSSAESELSTERLEQAGQASQELMEIKAGFSDDQRRVTHLMGQRSGRKQITNAIQKLLTVTDLLDLKTIKESKQYKGYRHIADNGESVIITTFEEYCTIVEGRSYESINLELSNFNQLGEEFFDAMRQIGIGPSSMRDYRKLPDDEKQALLEVAQTGDKDSFVELASTLITKHQREKEATTKQLDELTKSVEAKDAVIKGKSEALNKKDEQLARLQLEKSSEITEQYMPGHVQLTALQDYTRRLTSMVTATFNAEIIKLFNEFDGQPPKHIELAARQAVGLIVTAAYGVADNMGFEPILDAEQAAEEPGRADAKAFAEYMAAQNSDLIDETETEGWTEEDDKFFSTRPEQENQDDTEDFAGFFDEAPAKNKKK